MHGEEKEVVEMESYKELGEKKKYLNILTKLRCAGNFKHNIKILNAGKTDIVVVKRPSKKRTVDKFLPCPHCYGFYLKDELWRHAQNAPSETKTMMNKKVNVFSINLDYYYNQHALILMVCLK